MSLVQKNHPCSPTQPMQLSMQPPTQSIQPQTKWSLTQPIEPVQSDTATLLEWWQDPYSTLNGGGTVSSVHKGHPCSPTQPMQPSMQPPTQSHTAPHSHFTWMVVGTHAAIHAAPGSHFTGMVVQIHTANLAHTVPHKPLQPPHSPMQLLYLNSGGYPCSHPHSPHASSILEWW